MDLTKSNDTSKTKGFMVYWNEGRCKLDEEGPGKADGCEQREGSLMNSDNDMMRAWQRAEGEQAKVREDAGAPAVERRHHGQVLPKR